jgi:hypothetical protein
MIMQRLCKSSASAKDDADVVAVTAPFAFTSRKLDGYMAFCSVESDRAFWLF